MCTFLLFLCQVTLINAETGRGSKNELLVYIQSRWWQYAQQQEWNVRMKEASIQAAEN